MKEFFADIESDFYTFMKRNGLGPGSRSNYISWLRFVNTNIRLLDSEISGTLIEQIIKDLTDNVEKREVYQTKSDLSNFKSSLNKFKSFVEDKVNLVNEDLTKEKIIRETNELDDTEKEALILARKGQGLFRQRIVRIFDSKCIISGFSKVDILIASHIKPWKLSSNSERLDENNGILLLPTYDKLFDKGYISFNDKGAIVFSELLDKGDIKLLNIDKNFSYRFNTKQLSYLEYHFDNIFLQ